METIIYLIRHSLKFSNSRIKEFKSSQSNIIRSEKIVLSVDGEKRALKLSELEELNNLDIVYTSNCVRTLDTAKYIIEKQNLDVVIDENFDEKRVGKSNEDEYPDWFRLQYLDENFKTIGGESRKEVTQRFSKSFDEVLNNNLGKRIAIFSHGYALTFFLMKYASLDEITNDRYYKFSYKDKVFFEGKLDAPEIFKLTFKNKNLIKIENIKIDYEEVKNG